MSEDMRELSKNISDLKRELAHLNQHKFIHIHNSKLRMVGLQLMRGLAFGFGSVAGATLVVSLTGYALNQMEVVPIIGEWAKQLASEIMQDSQSAN